MFWTFLIPVVGLTISTVYGRFHYGIDALAGVLLVAIVFPLGLKLKAWLEKRMAEVAAMEEYAVGA